MKLLLFGTGDYYKKYKKWFRPEDVVALIDNDERKQGTEIDGYRVLSPQQAVLCNYDNIVILSVHEQAMREQLISLGADSETIIGYSALPAHRKMLKNEQSVKIIASERETAGAIKSMGTKNAVLLMSHNLDLNGASLALYYAGKCLKENGYHVVFASWNDGPLADMLSEDSIPVIIDANLEIKTANETAWADCFDRVMCNTLNYYYYLSNRSKSGKYIWWLHDPEMFYKTLNAEIFRKISRENLTVCAAGPIAAAAVKKYMPDADVRQLLYGIPDVSGAKRKEKKKSRLEAAVIANIQAYKGQDILIEAVSLLSSDEREMLRIRIVGNQESAYAAGVKKKAEPLAGTIEFTGPVGREKVQEILEGLDVLICPSRVDTMSLSCGEAVRHQVPCIVSDAVGMAAYINDGENGLIFKNGNHADLAEKLRWCIHHAEELKLMGNRGRVIYEKYFSMDVFGGRLLSVVEDAYGL